MKIGEGSVSLALGPTKCNVQDKNCVRNLRRSCFATAAGDRSEVGTSICPVHALARVLARRTREGCSHERPLFPGRGGSAMRPADAVKKIGLWGVIQYLGRWGSLVV